MKFLFLVLITLIAAVSIALLAMEDPGYILIAIGPWTIETTLVLLVVVLLIGFIALYYTLRLGSGIRHIPEGLRFWSNKRKERRAERSLTKGLIELSEGQWVAAERDVVKFASKSRSPLLNYLAAARAAQAQGADVRRDQYLKLAHESYPDADIAVGLTQAELQLNNHQLEQALATLRHLQQLAPKHTQVLRALASLYVQLEDWEHLLELLPSLKKRKVMDNKSIEDLSLTAYQALLNSAKGEDATQVWSRIPHHIREQEKILTSYAQRLIESGHSDQVEPLLRQGLRHQFSDNLMRLYGLLETNEPARQLALVEDYLKDYETNATVLLSAGRLSLRNKLWGKARSYLEASVNSRPSAEAFNELGNLLEQLGEREAAAECFHAGLRLVPGCEYPVASAIPAAEDNTESLAAPGRPLLTK